ncbi:Ubiquinone biosynthesis O-methyltransferase [subsurface metagenome]
MVKFVKNRVEEIMEKDIFKDKTVLELGCVGTGDDDQIGGENWLHGRISKVSRKIIGLDIDKKGVKKLKKEGYGVRYKDVEKRFDLKEKFDIIIAARVLEHIQNLKVFMENIHRHLKKSGLFIIITPNAHSISFFIQLLIKGRVDISKKHTHWHDINTIKNLLKSNGFEVILVEYSHSRPIFKRLRGYLVQMFWIFFPKRMGRQIFLIAKLKK